MDLPVLISSGGPPRGNPGCSSRKQSETLEIWTIFGNIGDEKLSACEREGHGNSCQLIAIDNK